MGKILGGNIHVEVQGGERTWSGSSPFFVLKKGKRSNINGRLGCFSSVQLLFLFEKWGVVKFMGKQFKKDIEIRFFLLVEGLHSKPISLFLSFFSPLIVQCDL